MKQKFHVVSLCVLLAGSVLSSGCATSFRPLGIEPVNKKPITLIQPQFKEAYYRVDRDGAMHFVLQTRSIDQATGQPVEQTAVVRMFWTPTGGKTSMNPTALNATYRYIIMTPNSVGMYEGAGFMQIYKKPGAKRMTARIVDGDLRLTESTANFNDNIGRSRFRGNFHAKLSDSQTVDRTLQAQKDFFARSLTIAGKTVESKIAPKADWNESDTGATTEKRTHNFSFFYNRGIF